MFQHLEHATAVVCHFANVFLMFPNFVVKSAIECLFKRLSSELCSPHCQMPKDVSVCSAKGLPHCPVPDGC